MKNAKEINKLAKIKKAFDEFIHVAGVKNLSDLMNCKQEIMTAMQQATSMTDVVSDGNKWYKVDSVYTDDHSFETMVFACDSEGYVTSWTDLDVALYDSLEDMQAGHKAMVEKWKAR